MYLLYISELEYDLLDEPDDDSDYESDYDSSNDDPDDVFDRINKY